MNLIYLTIVTRSHKSDEVKVEQWMKNLWNRSDSDRVSRKKVKES